MPQLFVPYDIWVFILVCSAFAMLCTLTIHNLPNIITSVLKSTFVQFNPAEEFNLLVGV